MTDFVCFFTGHREIGAEDRALLERVLVPLVHNLVRGGYTVFKTGGALGFDTVASEAVLKVKKEEPSVRLCLELPCRAQASRWSQADRARYDAILEAADSINYVSDEYTPWCMQARNRRLVDGSDIGVAFCRKESGGTAATCRYAKEKGIPLINLAAEIEKMK